MADLGKHLSKNQDRFKKREALKAAQSLPMPDPMIGYGQVATSRKGTVAADPAPMPPATERLQAEPQTQTVAEDKPVKDPTQDAASTETASVKADTTTAPEDQAPDREAKAKRRTPQAKDGVITIKNTYRFTEADYKRAETIAKNLGVTPEVILLKVVQSVVLEDADFTEAGEKPRAGPIVRRELKFPKKQATAWIAAHDPLGVISRQGDVLRQVAYNALDRTAEKLLPQLEAKKRNAG